MTYEVYPLIAQDWND